MESTPLQKNLDTMKQVIKEVNELKRLNTGYEEQTQARIKKLMEKASSQAEDAFKGAGVGVLGGLAAWGGYALNLTNPVGWAIIGATVVGGVSKAIDKSSQWNQTMKEIKTCEVEVNKIRQQSEDIQSMLYNIKDKDQELKILSQALQNKQKQLIRFDVSKIQGIFEAIFKANLELFKELLGDVKKKFNEFEITRKEILSISMNISELFTKRITQLELGMQMTQNASNQYQQGNRVKSQDELYAQMTQQPSTQSVLDYLNNI